MRLEVLPLLLLFLRDSMTQYSTRWQPGRFCNQCGCCNQPPRYTNPCGGGEPILTSGGVPAFCNWQARNACPSSHFCHVGTSVVTTCCCPSQGNPCNMTVSSGSGNGQLSRWYYDATSRTCRQFIYRGLLGNQNNFVTKEQCESTCPVLPNPCLLGEPATDREGNRLVCGVDRLDSCPARFWCHVGDSAATTACCAQTGYACNLAVNSGLGESSLTRWYYDAYSKSCKTFIYQGTKGNENNFLSQFQCEMSGCPMWENPCTSPLERNSAISCIPGANTCPSGSWCHAGATTDSTVCCPGATSPCGQPVEEGEGSLSLPRWFYDAGILVCDQFTYKGLKGNQNNFLSKRDCENSGCQLWENPCISAIERQNARSCSVGNPNCFSGFFCHFGSGPDTTICCPGGASPCRLPRDSGRGTAALPRWYYDAATQTCLSFTYRGLKGNENSFLTKEDCENSGCPLWQNPCVSPVERSTGISCARGESCPQGSWCHRGTSLDTTICCPGAVDPPCTLPRVNGIGANSVTRWYADPNEGLCGSCKTFLYQGLKGNQNNFLSREECEQSCPSCVNPCQDSPLLGNDGRPQQCAPSNPCPLSFFCNIGTTQDTTVCCPSRGDPCSEPLAEGEGEGSLQRWYYRPQTRSCQPFTYRGLKGNQNNFVSRTDCEAICPVWVNACRDGEPILEGGRPRECTAASPCPLTHFCHLGADPSTTMCCLSSGDPCVLPRLPGEGTSSLQRWYFDPRSEACQQFTYRGLRGNENNFLTREDCRAVCYVPPNPCRQGSPPLDPSGSPITCSALNTCPSGTFCHVGSSLETTTCCPSEGDPCKLPRVDGEGNARLNRWYFDMVSGRCQQFSYGGIKGNENNFLSQTDCQQTCPEVNPCAPPDSPYLQNGGIVQCQGASSCPATHFCHVGADDFTTVCCPRRGNPCDQPQARGIGTATLERWYFDQEADECRRFPYAGLQGNENNFLSLRDCNQTCPGFQGYCPHAKPLLVGREPQVCSVETACPQEFVCHINTNPAIAASICCPAPDSFCFQPRDRGNCSGTTERRFGYEPSTNTCQEFSYSGCGGNLNNFRSLETCTSICCNQFRRRRRSS